jgi:hypothetical protein
LVLRVTSNRACTCAVAQITASGQLDPVIATKADSALGNRFVDRDDLEVAQEASRRHLEIGAGADHDLHPCDDADRLLLVSLKLGTRLGHGVEVVDQDVGVEQRLHHSRRTFSW